MPWVIKSKRNGEYVFATDYRYHPTAQVTRPDRGILLGSKAEAFIEMKHRRCGDAFYPVEVAIIEIDTKERTQGNGTKV